MCLRTFWTTLVYIKNNLIINNSENDRFDKYNKYTVQNCNHALSAYVNPYSFFLVINNLTFSISFYMTTVQYMFGIEVLDLLAFNSRKLTLI